MSGEAAFTRSWRVGPYQATLTCPMPTAGGQRSACIEWSPPPGQLTAAEIQQYRAGRDAALRALAAELGINVAVVDL